MAGLTGLSFDQPDTWQGPIASAYGWHLVRVSGRQPAREPLMQEVIDAVQRDYLQDRRRRANDEFYQGLKSRYEIVVLDPEA